MIVKEDFLNKLRQYFALNLYEAKIWTALLSRGVSTAGELADIGNVPRSRAYDILESLEKKGFVVMKLGKPIKYIAVDPKEVVIRVQKLMRDNAEDHVKQLDALRGTDMTKELDLLFKQGIEFVEPTDLAGAIRSRHNIYSHIDQMVRGAEKTVILMTTSKGLIKKAEVLKPVLEKLKKKGVRIRIASQITKENMATARDLSKVAEVKHVDKINARFCLVDGKELTFMVMNDENVHPSYDVGVWVNTPYFASAMESMFDLAWQDMKPLNSVKG